MATVNELHFAAADPTTWAFKDGVRAALTGDLRSSNPCDPIAEAARHRQWLYGYDFECERASLS